jgi:cytochrome P450
MFQAGTDTSYAVLEYIMVELMQNPALMAKLQAEVRAAVPKGREMVTEDDVNGGLPYLKAVVKETLRTHASAPLLVPHLSMADCDVEGYTIPSGTRVLINVWALAKDPSYWEDADKFMPERFMEGGSAADVDFRGNDFSFLPFGSGRRMCPGINFAIPLVELMAANLVYHFNWELPPELKERGIDMTEAFGLTMHRATNLFLVPVVPH